MTPLLDHASSLASKLPSERQDFIARRLLEFLRARREADQSRIGDAGKAGPAEKKRD